MSSHGISTIYFTGKTIAAGITSSLSCKPAALSFVVFFNYDYGRDLDRVYYFESVSSAILVIPSWSTSDTVSGGFEQNCVVRYGVYDF